MVRWRLSLFWVFLPLFYPVPAAAVYGVLPSGARPSGMAGAFVALADDANSPLTNPAGMSNRLRAEITGYHTRLYGLEGLSQTMISAVFPAGIGWVGLSVQSSGGALYRETTVGFSFSRKIAPPALIGLTARRTTVAIARYCSSGSWSMDAGLQLRLPSGFRLGIAGNTPDQSGSFIRVGVGRMSEQLGVGIQIDHDPRSGFTWRLGQEFRPMRFLVLRGGITAQPSQLFAGCGLNVSNVTIDYSVASHPVLGATHRFSLSLGIGKERKR